MLPETKKQNANGGFTVRNDLLKDVGLVRMKAWGFWDDGLAKDWLDASLKCFEEMRTLPAKRWCVVVDNSEFPAQLESVKATIGQAMQRAAQLGMTKSAVILSSTLTKMQLRSIAQKSGAPGLSFHLSESEAIAELLKS